VFLNQERRRESPGPKSGVVVPVSTLSPQRDPKYSIVFDRLLRQAIAYVQDGGSPMSVKAVGPAERARSSAESLDALEASPTIINVMARRPFTAPYGGHTRAFSGASSIAQLRHRRDLGQAVPQDFATALRPACARRHAAH
jgi:hypothetical protein